MEKEEKIKSFLEQGLQANASYHSEKDIMVHSGILVEITLLAAIISIEDFSKLQIIQNFSTIQLIIGFSIFWYFLHSFVRTQQRLKRWAAIQYAGYFGAYNEFCTKKYKTILKKDKKFKKNQIKHENKTSKFKKFTLKLIDQFIPITIVSIKSDINKTKIPKFIKRHIEKSNSYSKKYELTLSIISILIYVIILLDILQKN